DGAAAELMTQVARQLRAHQRHVILVAGPGRVENQLQLFGVPRAVRIFPSQDAAVAALQTGRPRPVVPTSWEEARAQTLAGWRQAQRWLASGDDTAVERALTAFAGLCRRAEACRRAAGGELAHRCRYCPLFQALGGRKDDVGCRSLLNPILVELSIG